MAKSRRVRHNPTGTLLINPRGKGKKVRRVRKNGGSFSKLLSRLTGRGKAARKGKRKNPLTVNPRKGARKAHSRRRNPLTVNPYTVNPRKRKSKARRNPLTVNPIRIRRRKNPGMLGGVQKSAMGMLGKIPLIGGMLAATLGGLGSALFGAIGVMPTAHLLPYVSKWIPDMVKPFAYSAGGLLLAGATEILPSFPYKKELQIGLAASGGAVDTFRWRTGKSQDIGEFSSLLAGDDIGDLGEEDMGDEDLSAEEIGEELDAMGVDDSGAPGVASEWAEADLGDADYCGHDMSAEEAEAASLGRRHYFSVYGDLEGDDLGKSHRAVRGPNKRRGRSQHAGKPGARWGWLIYWVGMENFQKASKLPAAERTKWIADMREGARKRAARLLEKGADSSTMEQAQLEGLLVAA